MPAVKYSYMRSNVCVSLNIGLGLDILGLIIVAITLSRSQNLCNLSDAA